MKCKSCESLFNDSNCSNCSTPAPTICPQCKETFHPFDDFCSNCGREVRFINYTCQPLIKKPVNLQAEHYECAADKNARTFMSGLWPVKVVTRYGIEKFSEPSLRSQLLGSCVKVSNKQFPAIHEAAGVCQDILGIEDNEVYISKVKSLQASVFGVGNKSYIVLTSGMVEIMDFHDTLFILGRQMGHVKSDHLLYLSLLDLVKTGVNAIPMVGPTLLNVLSFGLMNWQRSSELTADRAGLLCCQSIRTATKALTKIALGSKELFNKIDFDEFLRQSTQIDQSGKWSEYMQVNPFVLTRIRELQSFINSPSWQRIMNRASHPWAPLVKCSYCSSSQRITRYREPLNSFSCNCCKKTLFVEHLSCPHCGIANEVDVKNDEMNMYTFVCRFCKKPYFEGIEEKLCQKWMNELPEQSPYSILDIPFYSSANEISHAYAKKMKGTKERKPTVKEKIDFDRSYRILTNTDKRDLLHRNLNTLFIRELYEKSEGEARQCTRCSTDIFGKYCTFCGRKKDVDDKVIAESKDWPSQILALVDTLSDSELSKEEIKLYEENSFYPCFDFDSRAFRCTVEFVDVDTPRRVKELYEKCSNCQKKAQEQNLLSPEPHFLIFTDKTVDKDLLHNVWPKRTSDNESLPFHTMIVKKIKDGSLKIAFSSVNSDTVPDSFKDCLSFFQFVLKHDFKTSLKPIIR